MFEWFDLIHELEDFQPTRKTIGGGTQIKIFLSKVDP